MESRRFSSYQKKRPSIFTESKALARAPNMEGSANEEDNISPSRRQPRLAIVVSSPVIRNYAPSEAGTLFGPPASDNLAYDSQGVNLAEYCGGRAGARSRAAAMAPPPAASPLSSLHIRTTATQHIDNSINLISPYVEYALGGTYCKTAIPAGPRSADKMPAKRGEIDGFSAESRNRMMDEFSRWDKDQLKPENFFLITLTYPSSIAPHPRTGKRHLAVFRLWFERTLGKVAGLLKMEPQNNGTVHFHGLLKIDLPDAWTVALLKEEIARKWAAIVVSRESDDKQRQKLYQNMYEVHAGLKWNRKTKSFNEGCVTQCRSWISAANYLAKYVTKNVKKPEGWKWPGRYWMVWRKDMLPRRIVREEVSIDEAFLLRRQMRRFVESKPSGRIVVTFPSGTVFRGWASVLKDACKEFGRGKTVQDLYEAQGCRIHHVNRRVGRGPGGIRVFMPAKDFVRLLSWARESCLQKLANGCDYYKRSFVNDLAFIGSAPLPAG